MSRPRESTVSLTNSLGHIQSHLKVLGRCYGEKNICNRFARMFMAEGEEELAGNAGKMIQMAEERHDQQV